MLALINKIKKLSFDNVSLISVDQIPFEPSLIELCEMNYCGNYGKSYTCPPYIGNMENLVNEIKSYKNAIVFQKIYTLEDSFDIEGMNEGHKNFRENTEKITEVFNNYNNFLILSAGGCKICKKCGATDNIPCRFPDRAFASLESYYILVSKLAQACGMNYINGENTVTYFGAVFC